MPHHMPFVRVGLNSLAICREEWIEKILTEAAEESNVPAWLAEDISTGINQYLQTNYQGSVIDSEELFSKITTTLDKVGLSDVAHHMDRTPPPVRISLTDLARRAEKTYDGAFFQLLEDKCLEVLESGAMFVECHGLVRACQELAGTTSWSPDAEEFKVRINERIDEFRRMGELSCPVFNVSVIF